MTNGQEQVNEEAKNLKSTFDSLKTKKIFLIGFGSLIGVAIVASLAFGTYRVYAKTGTDGFTVGVSKFLNLPIARVNGRSVKYSEYVSDLAAIKNMQNYDKKNNGPTSALTETNLSDQVMYRQVNNIFISTLANKYGVKVEKTDLENVKKDILEKQFGSMAEAEKAIKERYGWSLEEFEKKVINQFIVQNKLVEKLSSDQVSKDKVKETAQSVLDQIKNGADFGEMAKKYGADGTASKGGDLGWFGKGDMVPQFETVAFELKKGELSPNVVETQFGYHILIVDDKKTEKVKDEKGKSVNKEMVKARHILFAYPTLESLLNQEIKTAKIKVYGKVNDPFKELQKNLNAGAN